MLNFRAQPLSSANPNNPAQPFEPSETSRHSPQPQSVEYKNLISGLTANIPFQNPETAGFALTHATKQISPTLAAALPSLLAESPDPDSASILFDRLVTESPETAHLLDQHNVLAHYAIVVFGHSRFLAETLIQNVDIFQSFIRERYLDLSFSSDDFQQNLSRFRSRSFETDISLLLARFKRREYVRIMLRDVLKIAPLSETTAEISALADVLIAEAVRDAESGLQRRFGTAQHMDPEGRLVSTHFSVLSLGKLGGNELNYSSDVDLLYLFGDGKESPEAAISNREYFVRLSQQVTDTLSRVTREGPVYRIDLRLRPQGNEGELAISLEAALLYYAKAAEDWERQALIKIRHSAGDVALAREFIRRVQPQIYELGKESSLPEKAGARQGEPEQLNRRALANRSAGQLNFAAIKTALVAREKMHKRRQRQRMQRSPVNIINIKLDHGGIRDIEFLVQCLQRVYGGVEPWLRSGGTLFSLQKLHDKRHISGKEFHDLTSAYEFLRHLEHRLQLRQGQQTHQLPLTQPELTVLQRSMEGYDPSEYQIADLCNTVQRRMANVAEIYQHIIYQQQSRGQVELQDRGFNLQSPPESADVYQSDQQIMRRLAEDAPELYRAVNTEDLSIQARNNLIRFLSSGFTSSGRYAEIIRNPKAVISALPVFDASQYLSDILIRNPEEIAAVNDLGEAIPRVDCGYLFASPLGRGRATADPVFEYVAASGNLYAEKLALLRKHFRHRILAVGAHDITSLCGVYESMDSITAAAEDAIATALAMTEDSEGLAIMAVGRLGSRELDVLSDADLLFVAPREIDCSRLTKSAEQIMQTLSAYTRDGMVFPVDTRLRPRGSAGELLITPAQLAAYFEQEAQPWEALMYTKLRFLAGSQELGDQVMSLAKELFHRFASDDAFLSSTREMRDKLAAAKPNEKNIKTSSGGSYDIDFLSGFLLIKHGIPNKQGSLRDRLWRCAEAGVLANSDAAQLDHAAELLRTTEHLARLALGRPHKWLPATEHAREVTEQFASRILKREFADGLEAELLQTFTNVRNIYERVMTSA